MENYGAELEIEVRQLKYIISIAEKQLNAIKENSNKQLADIMEEKRELWENTRHSISKLSSAENFYELAALSQYSDQVSGKTSVIEMKAERMLALERMIQSPYFARIDFLFEDENEAEKIYIGRTSLMDEKSVRIYVYDWRSPIASVFYRFGAGKAFYDAPNGKINGEVRLKRQYEIQGGALEYFFDADVQIMDEFLRKLLSQNASPKMKTIVETIQRDQDMVIRDMESDLMMVQGVAGSGKTSIALHRTAYLMYRELSSRLSAQNIMIISPNPLFEQYISNVLPELGEDNVVTMDFEGILKAVLPDISVQSRHRFLEDMISCRDEEQKKLIKDTMNFKTSPQFKKILDRFIYDIPRKWIEFSDMEYDGKLIAERNLLKAEILDSKRKLLPLGVRLKHLEGAVFEKVHGMHKNRMEKLKNFVKGYSEHAFEVEEFARLLSIRESTLLFHRIHMFTEPDFFALYKKLFENETYFNNIAKGIKLPDNIDRILKFTQKGLEKDSIPYDDGLALAYLQLKLNGFHDNKSIMQVVIDEVQDYYPLHFEILNILFPHSRYTILGDIHQTIEKIEDTTLYEQINKILNKKKSTFVTMNKSFRCTNEILDFSKKFLNGDMEIESFNRSGDVPMVCQANNREELDMKIAEEIKVCTEAKYQSIGLICKTEKEAEDVYQRLKDKLKICLIDDDTITDIKGVFILPLYMAKGLEFDAVLLCDIDKDHYFSESDKKLLYIGCTRALHRLSLFYTGEISPLL